MSVDFFEKPPAYAVAKDGEKPAEETTAAAPRTEVDGQLDILNKVLAEDSTGQPVHTASAVATTATGALAPSASKIDPNVTITKTTQGTVPTEGTHYTSGATAGKEHVIDEAKKLSGALDEIRPPVASDLKTKLPYQVPEAPHLAAQREWQSKQIRSGYGTAANRDVHKPWSPPEHAPQAPGAGTTPSKGPGSPGFSVETVTKPSKAKGALKFLGGRALPAAASALDAYNYSQTSWDNPMSKVLYGMGALGGAAQLAAPFTGPFAPAVYGAGTGLSVLSGAGQMYDLLRGSQ